VVHAPGAVALPAVLPQLLRPRLMVQVDGAVGLGLVQLVHVVVQVHVLVQALEGVMEEEIEDGLAAEADEAGEVEHAEVGRCAAHRGEERRALLLAEVGHEVAAEGDLGEPFEGGLAEPLGREEIGEGVHGVLGVGEETGFVQAGPITGRHDHVIRLPDVHVPRPSATDIVQRDRARQGNSMNELIFFLTCRIKKE